MSLLAVLLLAAQASAAAGPVIVLPPEAPADPEWSWLGEAVADALPQALVELGVPAVTRADRLLVHEALAIPASPLTRATSVRIAEALSASRLVVGSGRVEAGRVTLSLQLLDVERGTLSAPLIAADVADRLPELLRGLAYDIALVGPARPTRARDEFLAATPTPPLPALRAYAQGLSAKDAAARAALLKQALTMFPAYDEARLALGRQQIEAGSSAAAAETLSRIGAPSPLQRTARFLQGLALLDLGRYRDAAAIYSGLAASEPTAPVLNNHALALLRLGPSARGGERASDVLRKAVELDPGLAEPPFNLGFGLLVEGDPDAAAFWLRGALRASGGDAHARLLLSWALRAAGKAAEAEQEWRTLLSQSSSYASAAQPDLSRRFERALVTEHPLVPDEDRWGDAQFAAAHVGRAEKLTEAGDLEGALRELTQAAILDPYGARVHHLLARTHQARGEPENALSELRMSLWCRDDPGVRLELAGLLAKAGRVKESRIEAGKVLKAQPGNPEAKRLLGKR